MRHVTVEIRGFQFEVLITKDHGYEPDVNAHEVEWKFDDVSPEGNLTPEEEDSVMQQIYKALEDSWDDD